MPIRAVGYTKVKSQHFTLQHKPHRTAPHGAGTGHDDPTKKRGRKTNGSTHRAESLESTRQIEIGHPIGDGFAARRRH
jgi:hypothetical protein